MTEKPQSICLKSTFGVQKRVKFHNNGLLGSFVKPVFTASSPIKQTGHQLTGGAIKLQNTVDHICQQWQKATNVKTLNEGQFFWIYCSLWTRGSSALLATVFKISMAAHRQKYNVFKISIQHTGQKYSIYKFYSDGVFQKKSKRLE